jgi:nucleoside-diphosphate-sugar epimerase
MHSWKISIVGGSGYVGSALAKHLSHSFLVKIIDIREPNYLDNNIIFEQCDIRQYEGIRKALADVDLVIHTAIIQIPKINEQKRFAYEVNILGTQNVCRAVDESPKAKGMILTGSWHVIGEQGLEGVIDESFGFRPDKVEDRARLYAFSKILQEGIVRFYDEMSEKIFGVIRMGTVLGEGMPEQTAANIFIERGLKEQSITPYKHSMYRPMLYVDIRDVCKAFEAFSKLILNGKLAKKDNSLSHIVNVVYPEPITVLELAEIVRDTIIELTNNKIRPHIEIIDKGLSPLFSKEDKNKFRVDTKMAKYVLGLNKLVHPRESIRHIIKKKLS